MPYRAPLRYERGTATSAFLLTWKGKAIEEAVTQASKEALRETLIACVEEAQALAPELTGDLKRDIQFEEPYETPQRIIGKWGNFHVRYSIFQNYGTSRIEAKFYLERAADKEYPNLARRTTYRYLHGNS